MASVLPVVLTVLNWGVYLSMYLVSRSKKVLYSGFQSSLILLYTIHPYIVKAGVTLISCRVIDNNTLYLTADVSLKCWQSTHLNYAIQLFLPMFIVYILGIPMAIFIFIFRLCKGQKRCLVTFFTAGYEISAGLWEVVICLRKAFLIIVLGLLGSGETLIQILSALVLLYLCLEWHIRKSPFIEGFLNKLEGFGLFVQLILLGFSFYFMASLNTNDTILSFISYVILLLVLGFILVSIGIIIAQIILYGKWPAVPILVASSLIVAVPPPSYNSSMLSLAPVADEPTR